MAVAVEGGKMKFVVDKLPEKCEECEYCAAALLQTALGVTKQVNVCALQTIAPPKTPTQEPNFIDVKESPIKNNCPCSDGKKIIDVNPSPIKPSSSLIL